MHCMGHCGKHDAGLDGPLVCLDVFRHVGKKQNLRIQRQSTPLNIIRGQTMGQGCCFHALPVDFKQHLDGCSWKRDEGPAGLIVLLCAQPPAPSNKCSTVS